MKTRRLKPICLVSCVICLLYVIVMGPVDCIAAEQLKQLAPGALIPGVKTMTSAELKAQTGIWKLVR